MEASSALLPAPPRCRVNTEAYLRAWERAGGLPLDSLERLTAAQREWFNFSPGGLALSMGGRCLVYARIWKGANNAIRESLLRAVTNALLRTAAAPRGPRFDHREAHFGVLQGSRLQIELGLRASKLCRFGSLEFTFVREPLSHFMSGFGEYAYRDVRFKEASRAFLHRNLTSADAEEVLTRILSGRPPAASGRHMYAMAGLIANGWQLSHLGWLENASMHWKEIMRASQIPALARLPLGLEADTLGRVYTAHESSSDPQGAKKAMRQILLQRPDLRYRLCALLALDYECYSFDFSRCLSGAA